MINWSLISWGSLYHHPYCCSAIFTSDMVMCDNYMYMSLCSMIIFCLLILSILMRVPSQEYSKSFLRLIIPSYLSISLSLVCVCVISNFIYSFIYWSILINNKNFFLQWTLIWNYLRDHNLNSFLYLPRRRPAAWYSSSIFNVLRNLNTLFYNGCTIFCVVHRTAFLLILSNAYYFPLLLVLLMSEYKLISS